MPANQYKAAIRGVHAASSEWAVPQSEAAAGMTQVVALVGNNQSSAIASIPGWTRVGASPLLVTNTGIAQFNVFSRIVSTNVAEGDPLAVAIAGGTMAGYSAVATFRSGVLVSASAYLDTGYSETNRTPQLNYPARGGLRLDIVFPGTYPRKFTSSGTTVEIFDAEEPADRQLLLGMAMGIRPGVSGASGIGDLWTSIDSATPTNSGDTDWGGIALMFESAASMVSAEGDLAVNAGIRATGTEAADLGFATLAYEANLVLDGVESGDVAPDENGPVLTVFMPTSALLTEGTYKVRVIASDVSGVKSVAIKVTKPTGAPVTHSFMGTGPHEIIEEVDDHTDNGTRTYVISARDQLDNETVVTRTVQIEVPLGDFIATLAVDSASVTEPTAIEFGAGLPANVVAQTVQLQRSPVGQNAYKNHLTPLPGPPFSRRENFTNDNQNGSFDYRVRVVDSNGLIGYSDPPLRVTITLPAGTSQEITPGLAETVEIYRRDTSQTIIFDLFDAQGAPLDGANPVVKLSRDNGPFEAAKGQTSSTDFPGKYIFWPTADDVNDEGRLTIAISAVGAAPVDPIQAIVVTPYGKR